MNKRLKDTIKYISKKNKILFITTSNRWAGDKDIPKSTQIANYISKKVKNVLILDAAKIKIYPCEGNISRMEGNNCGVKEALLTDSRKNPSGLHRCWASINNKDDELWKISKALFESDAIIFFGSIRWGQMNAVYQKLIERLTWIENRHTTLGKNNVIKNIDAGLICTGQNWNGVNVIKTQKKVLSYFGFKTPNELFWNWQYTKNAEDESQKSYKSSQKKFDKELFHII